MAKQKQQQMEWNLARQIAFANTVLNSKHGNHTLDVELTPKGPHSGKIVCKTCNKHVAWISKAILETL